MSLRRPAREGRSKVRRLWRPLAPYLVVLGCLFALSLAAPRSWRQHDEEPATARLALDVARPAQIVAGSPAELIAEDEAQRGLELAIHAGGPIDSDVLLAADEEPSPAAAESTAVAIMVIPPMAILAGPAESATGGLHEGGSLSTSETIAAPAPTGQRPAAPETAPPRSTSALPPATTASPPSPAASRRLTLAAAGRDATDRLAMRSGPETELDGPALSLPTTSLKPAATEQIESADPSGALAPLGPAAPAGATTGASVEGRVDAFSWPAPAALLADLESMRSEAPLASWASGVAARLGEWTRTPAPTALRAEQILAGLREAAGAAEGQAQRLTDVALREQLQQARYALLRRLDIWEAALAIQKSQLQVAAAAAPETPPRRLLARNVDAVARLTQREAAGRTWRDYLLLPALRRLAQRDAQGVDDEERRTARTVLLRLARPRLNRRQREFIENEEFTSLEATLRAWAAAPVDMFALLQNLEAYESSPTIELAAVIADDYWSLAWSDDAGAQALADRIEEHYRDGNLRVAVSADLVNRFLPPPQTETDDVNDVIVGADVRGRSTTTTNLHVRTLADDGLARVGLEANGVIQSDTVAVSGPAAFRSSGDTTFQARKLIKLTPEGIRVVPSTARASATDNLVDLETQYDGVPLLSAMARGIAMSQREDSQDQARREVEEKVVRRVESRLDAEANARIAAAHARLEERVLRPLRGLSLVAVPLEMYSTDRRVITRLRLAGDDQLGAHTPRPLAPSDSLLSIQIHQSSLNNALAQLHLDGQQYTLPELFLTVAEKFGRADAVPPEDLDKRAVVQFAEHDAVRVYFLKDLVEIELTIAKIKIGRNTYDDFRVRAYYKPAPEGLSPNFVREGIVELKTAGPPVLRDQLVLRTVFVKLFPADDPVSVIGDRLDDDPRMEGLKITQMVVTPGWVGLAIGPVDSQWVNDLVHTAMK